MDWWIYAVVGLIFFLLGNAMLKISEGLRSNNEVLHDYGSRVGDDRLPSTAPRFKSISFWIAALVIFLGACFVIYGVKAWIT